MAVHSLLQTVFAGRLVGLAALSVVSFSGTKSGLN